MPRPTECPSQQRLRREIAALAARLIAEDGINDYGLAKRKAARQLGAINADELPNNAEIEAEVRTYQAVFQDDEQRSACRQCAWPPPRSCANWTPSAPI
jgi:hypothetical protein